MFLHQLFQPLCWNSITSYTPHLTSPRTQSLFINAMTEKITQGIYSFHCIFFWSRWKILGAQENFLPHSPQCCHNLPLISEEELFSFIAQKHLSHKKTNCEHRSGHNLPPWFQTKLVFLFLCLKAVIVTSLKPICTIQVQDKRSNNEIFTQTL